MAWTDSTLLAGPGGTHIRKVHIDEIREAIDAHIGQLGADKHPVALPTSDPSGGKAGFMSPQDKQWLLDLESLAAGTVTSVGVTFPVENTGSATHPIITVPVVTSSVAGLISFEEHNKLAGIQDNATANLPDSELKNRANHTGTQSADTIVNGDINKVVTQSEKDAWNATKSIPIGAIIDFWPLTGDIEDYFQIGGTNNGAGKTIEQGSPKDMSSWRLCNGGGGMPDLRDRFIFGAGSIKDKTYSQTLAENPNTLYPGEATHSLTPDEGPEHLHDIYASNWQTGGGSGGMGYGTRDRKWGSTEISGKGKPHNNMPPYVTIWKIIRVA